MSEFDHFVGTRPVTGQQAKVIIEAVKLVFEYRQFVSRE